MIYTKTKGLIGDQQRLEELDKLEGEEKERVEHIVAVLDHLGYLVKHHLCSPGDLPEWAKDSAKEIWGRVRAYAVEMRSRPGRQNYAKDFEWLVGESGKSESNNK